MNTEDPQQTDSAPAPRAPSTRRPVTLVIRAFVNDDGELYGMVNEPGARSNWQATFSQFSELVELVCARLPTEQLSGQLADQLSRISLLSVDGVEDDDVEDTEDTPVDRYRAGPPGHASASARPDD